MSSRLQVDCDVGILFRKCHQIGFDEFSGKKVEKILWCCWCLHASFGLDLAVNPNWSERINTVNLLVQHHVTQYNNILWNSAIACIIRIGLSRESLLKARDLYSSPPCMALRIMTSYEILGCCLRASLGLDLSGNPYWRERISTAKHFIWCHGTPHNDIQHNNK